LSIYFWQDQPDMVFRMCNPLSTFHTIVCMILLVCNVRSGNYAVHTHSLRFVLYRSYGSCVSLSTTCALHV